MSDALHSRPPLSPADWAASPDWSTLPAPLDDGATDHLVGLKWPSIPRAGTDGEIYDLSNLSGLTVVYAYPRTGVPGVPSLDGWDAIPGARGCTPQSCSFRDHFDELKELGVSHVFGLSTQDSEYQREAVARLHLPFPLLSDADFALVRALDLPTFTTSGIQLLKRFTVILNRGTIEQVLYPVFPPDQSASEVIRRLTERKID